ncbi:hypothetical protein COO60DRAFT_58051 [Scenedesmus sp. NREL 46B-D3]|nr:hypothetical protein COO60DRAFT_58051 [Scenedesmus sp. NREL 46B-D3]
MPVVALQQARRRHNSSSGRGAAVAGSAAASSAAAGTLAVSSSTVVQPAYQHIQGWLLSLYMMHRMVVRCIDWFSVSLAAGNLLGTHSSEVAGQHSEPTFYRPALAAQLQDSPSSSACTRPAAALEAGRWAAGGELTRHSLEQPLGGSFCDAAGLRHV